MSHKIQVNFDLTDDEYMTLTAEAKQTGQEIEILIRTLFDEILTKRAQLAQKSDRSLSKKERTMHFHDEDIIISAPTGEPDTEETKRERKHLGKLFGYGKPMSKMIIEDRGPY